MAISTQPRRPDLPATAPTLPVMPATRPTPSGAGYWIAAIVFVAGLLAAGALLGVGSVRVVDRIDTFPATRIPGALTVRLGPGVSRTIYLRGPERISLFGLQVAVRDPAGDLIPVPTYAGDLHIAVPGAAGTALYAVGTFRTSAAGAYRISAAGAAPAGSSLVVGPGVAGTFLTWGVAGLAVLGLATCAAVALVIVTAARRSRARRAIPPGW